MIRAATPDLKEGWSEMDLFDEKNGFARIEEIADFLCRREQEVREKIAELQKDIS